MGSAEGAAGGWAAAGTIAVPLGTGCSLRALVFQARKVVPPLLLVLRHPLAAAHHAHLRPRQVAAARRFGGLKTLPSAAYWR